MYERADKLEKDLQFETRINSEHFPVLETEHALREQNPLDLFNNLIPTLKEYKTVSPLVFNRDVRANTQALLVAREIEYRTVSNQLANFKQNHDSICQNSLQ